MNQVAVPVIPTVKVVITFTKFVELEPTEYFYTPLSNPWQFGNDLWPLDDGGCRHQQNGSSDGRQAAEEPFAIPNGYVWSSSDDKCRKTKSTKRTK